MVAVEHISLSLSLPLTLSPLHLSLSLSHTHSVLTDGSLPHALALFAERSLTHTLAHLREFAVKVVPKRLPVSPFSGLLKGCKGHKTHRFENGGTNQIRKTGKQEVVFGQPLPQTLYRVTWQERWWLHRTHEAAPP